MSGTMYDPNKPPPPPPSSNYQNSQPAAEGKGMGWLWFILIYGVGNLILYKTTGIFLIPIPRR